MFWRKKAPTPVIRPPTQEVKIPAYPEDDPKSIKPIKHDVEPTS